MKQIEFPEGSCKGHHSDTDIACTKCYIADHCKDLTEEKRRKKTVDVIEKATPKSLHSHFIKELNGIFPHFKLDEYGNKGLEHIFLNDNKRPCVQVKTRLPDYAMQINVCDHGTFVTSPLDSEEAVRLLMERIKKSFS